MATNVAERLFIGIYPGGIVYADRKRQEQGDYKRVAFLPYDTLELSIAPGKHPEALLAAVRADAAKIAARRGEQFRVSSSGQTVTLGRVEGQTGLLVLSSRHPLNGARVAIVRVDPFKRFVMVRLDRSIGEYAAGSELQFKASEVLIDGRVEGMTIATHLLAAGVGYGFARAVEEPEKTRELAQRAGAKLSAEGKRAFASAKTIAGRATGVRGKATLVRHLWTPEDERAHARQRAGMPAPRQTILLRSLYRVSPPLMGNEYVVTSAIRRPSKGPEVIFFASDDAGNLTSYRDLAIAKNESSAEVLWGDLGYAVETDGRASGRKPTPRSYAERLWANGEAFHNDQINYSTYSSNNKQIWSEVDAAGRETHDKVLALLRKENRGARR